MRLASSVLVVPRPSPGTGHHIQLTREVQGSEVITGRECHDHTWYDPEEIVLTPQLLQVAGSRGAVILSDPDFAHPYQDAWPEMHRRRQNAIAEFFLK